MLRRVADIIERSAVKERQFFSGDRSSHASRDSHHHRASRDLESLWNQRPGSDQAFFPDHTAIQEDRPHPDQTEIADACAVNDRAMANRDAFAESNGDFSGRMKYAAVLDVTCLPDRNGFDVAAQDDQRPDGRVFVNDDATDQLGRLMHERCGVDFGNGILEGPLHIIFPLI